MGRARPSWEDLNPNLSDAGSGIHDITWVEGSGFRVLQERYKESCGALYLR